MPPLPPHQAARRIAVLILCEQATRRRWRRRRARLALTHVRRPSR